MKRFMILNMFVGVVIFGGTLKALADTSFTFQGELQQNGNPANGSFNLDFSLWDAAAGGIQIGSDIMFNNQAVAGGRFTVELDFGDSAFDGTDRWLEISVNGNELDPRAKITHSPYSIQTRGIFVDENNNVGIGTTFPEAELHVQRNQAALRLQDDEQPQSYGLIEDTNASQLKIIKSTGNGGAVVDVNPLSLDGISNALVRFFRSTNTTGSRQVQFLRGNNSTQASASIGVDGENSFLQAHGGNLGIGTTEPDSRLDVFSSTSSGIHVEATGLGSDGDGVVGEVSGAAAFAVFGIANGETSLAGAFVGDVEVFGMLAKSGGSFKIDHPLDPANKFLSHSFVESPDMMNIYNGNVDLDTSGRSTITLPEWFETLNREFRYQLTCLGGFAPVYVESEIENNQFTIAGGKAGMKVSWQVTGVRQDAWAEANRIPIEEQKVGFEVGHYLHPEVYGLAPSSSILAARESMRAESESEFTTQYQNSTDFGELR